MVDTPDTRISTALPPALLARVEAYRATGGFASQADAIRRLIEIGLDTARIEATDVEQ